MLTSRPRTGIPKRLLYEEKNMSNESEDISIGITGLAEWDIGQEQSGRGLTLLTNRGPIQTIIHHDPSKPSYRGVVWVGGARGGFDGPGGGLYRILGAELSPGSPPPETSLWIIHLHFYFERRKNGWRAENTHANYSSWKNIDDFCLQCFSFLEIFHTQIFEACVLQFI